jgi:4-hydroxyphenylacetate 3-monooxygenase
MAARTGEQFLRGLVDSREIWVGSDKVSSPVDHPSLRGAALALAEVFDLQHRQAEACLMPDPETGEPINVSHMIPQSRDDLERRHRGLECVAEYSVGLMGRTPDYMNVTFAGFAGRADEWGANGNEEGAENLVRYQKKLRRDDLSLTHTIVHSTVDLANKGKYPIGLDPVQLHKVGETEHGIVVSGSRVLATLAPFADELAVYPGGPMPDAASVHALSFCIPMTAPGLKFICRDSVALNSHKFDHPFSSRFDEQDAFVIFDNVEVPRERLFIDCNLHVYNSVMKTTWWPNIMQQTMIRAQTKLEFAWGLASSMAEAINAVQPQVQQQLGEIGMFSEFARTAIFAAEQGAREYGNGMWACDVRPLGALRAALPTWFPRVNEIIRQLGSHNLLTTPSRAALADPKLRPLIDRYLLGAGVDAEQRSRLFRLAWDFTGTALASRNEQYERFYLGSVGRNLTHLQMTGDRTRAKRLVDRFLTEELEAMDSNGQLMEAAQ